MVGLENVMIGDTVLAYWEPGGAYFVGTAVEKVDSGFTILFEDGDQAVVPAAKIRKYDLGVGAAVIARWSDGEFYKGIIAQVVGRAFYIHYDDGDKRWVPLCWIAVI
jgi:hypothetical protein